MTAIAVTIAGSDSGGGAGIQADLKTFSALGVYGASVITALTAQNTRGVTGIHDVPPDFIAAQIDAVFSDLEVDAVKIGMLSHAGDDRGGGGRPRPLQARRKVVLDPVMVATSGDRLLAARRGRQCCARLLIPRALVITPNLPEAAALLDAPIADDEAEMRAQARAAARARREGGADQGRARAAAPRASICWSTRDARRAARRAAHRHAEHPRHRLHAVVGDRRRASPRA